MTNPNQGPNHYPSLPPNMYPARSRNPDLASRIPLPTQMSATSRRSRGFTAPAAQPSRNWVPILCILAVILAMLDWRRRGLWIRATRLSSHLSLQHRRRRRLRKNLSRTRKKPSLVQRLPRSSSSPAQNNSPRYQHRQQPRQQTHTATQREDYPAGLSAKGWDGIPGAQCNGGEAVYAAKKSAPSAHIVICDEGSGLVYRGSWSSGPAVGTASGSGTSYTATFNNVSQLLINGSEFTIVPDSTSSDYSQRDTGQFSTV